MVYEVGCSVRRRSKADETPSSCCFLCWPVPCVTLSVGEGRSAMSGCPFCPSANIQACSGSNQQSAFFLFLLDFLAAAHHQCFLHLVGPKRTQGHAQGWGNLMWHSLPPKQQARALILHHEVPLAQAIRLNQPTMMSLASITHTPPQHQHWVVGIMQSPLWHQDV